MSAPHYVIKANQVDGNVLPNHQRNPSWCVAFIRFNEPCSMYSVVPPSGNVSAGSMGAVQANSNNNLMVVENDCIGFTTNSPKGSFSKSATMIFKVGDIYYPHAVAPGDWVLLWVQDHQEDIDNIVSILNQGNGGNGQLNDWNSGLKFMGRVVGVSDPDTLSVNGVRTLTQTIQCQAFTEFATSIYYTYISQSIINPSLSIPSDSGDPVAAAAAAAANQQSSANIIANQILSSTSLYQKLDTKFLDYYRNHGQNSAYNSPDDLIMFAFTLLMGIARVDNIVNQVGASGEYSDSITIPQQLATILGMPNATQLFQVYNLYLGLQKYSTVSTTQYWQNFSPTFPAATSVGNKVFYRTASRCKGSVPFIPPLWDNVNMWDFLNRFLNPIVNEMYTTLRVNSSNQILPTLVIREMPFGTNLFNLLKTQPAVTIDSIKSSQQNTNALASTPASDSTTGQSATQTRVVQEQEFKNTSSAIPTDSQDRAMFSNLPRWIISETMLDGINTATSEVNRVNFVQVWASSQNLQMIAPGASSSGNGLSSEQYKAMQFNAGNIISDPLDVSRNGLRAVIKESQFDYLLGSGSQAGYWARMNADWLFNGHLKPAGTISSYGIVAPICEGDNCQVRGIVYHINNVSHTGSLAPSGHKTFKTILQVSNGILATSLTEKDQTTLPAFPIHDKSLRRPAVLDTPGVTDVQRITSPKRNVNGDRQ